MHIYHKTKPKGVQNMDMQYLLTETLKPYDKLEIPISSEDYDRLKADIATNGIKTPLHVEGHTDLAGGKTSQYCTGVRD